jgi:hypothetical protein
LQGIRFSVASPIRKFLPEVFSQMQQRFSLLVATVVLFSSAMFAQINSPTFRYVAINFPGAFSTDATGINNSGEIVGFYQQGTNCNSSFPSPCRTHGFKLINKQFTTINVSGALNTTVMGVNDGGDVVGFFETTAHAVHGFLLHHTGQLQIINPPSPLFGVPEAVNNSLVVVGGDFSWQNGKFTKIDFRTTPAEDQVLSGISNAGIIVGSLFHQDFWNGILKAGSDFDLFPRVNGTDTHILGINGRGDVVGNAVIGNGGYVAFHAEANETSDKPERPLNPIIIRFPGSSGTIPHSINFQQAIVGTFNINNIDHGFLAVH